MALPALLRVLSVLLAACTLLTTAQENDIKTIPLRTHSLQPPYLDTDLQSRWWDFGGSAIVRADQYIRLVSQKQQSQAGWLFSRVPLTATNWEITLEFKISGNGHLFGDGLALWVTKERGEGGPVFGMRDKFTGLGIFFDTYKNNRPGTMFPYVMAMVGDGNTAYDQANDGKSNELAGCSARGIRNAEHPTKARVTYFQDKTLTVQLMYRDAETWTSCFKVEGVTLPGTAYLGFSAETGELSDNHDVVRVTTNNLYSPSGSTGSAGAGGSKEYSRGKGKQGKAKSRPVREGGSWLWFFAKLILFGLVVVGGYVGYTAYRARRRDRF